MAKADWYGDVPKTDKEKREAVEQFLDWRFPEAKQLAYLREGLALNREHLEALEREGYSGIATEILWSRAKWHERQIARLLQ
jgi:hypothetical protein